MKPKRIFVNREKWVQELVKKDEKAKLEKWLLYMEISLKPPQFLRIPTIPILR